MFVVAPLVGAWIEITSLYWGRGVNYVAPLVGAWIEIFLSDFVATPATSLPSWERGLKCIFGKIVGDYYAVAPLVGAWIEMRMQSIILAA